MAKLESISSDQFWSALVDAHSGGNSAPILIDVRSEGEFAESAVPLSINVPILNNEERHLVGAEYKAKGQQSAIELGFKLVHPALQMERTNFWKEAVLKCGAQYLTCWRGGLRSQLAQEWLSKAGVPIKKISGGTKEIRRRAIRELLSLSSSEGGFILYGRTGCGKTEFLKKICETSSRYGFLDLEACAHHRGSAFGAWLGHAQPSQIESEYRMALQIAGIRKSKRKIVVEGESRMIGKCVLPLSVYQFMSDLPIVVLESSLEDRIRQIHHNYFVEPLTSASRQEVFESFLVSLKQIERRLGGKLYTELLALRTRAFNENNEDLNFQVIERLLKDYYDPLYDRFLQKLPRGIEHRVELKNKESMSQFLDKLAK